MQLCFNQNHTIRGYIKTQKFSNTPSYLMRCRYCDVIMGAKASQNTSLTIVYSTVYSAANQRKYQSSASLAFVWGIHRSPVNSPHNWPVTRKMFPFDDAIMVTDVLPLSVSWYMEYTVKEPFYGSM